MKFSVTHDTNKYFFFKKGKNEDKLSTRDMITITFYNNSLLPNVDRWEAEAVVRKLGIAP